MKVFVFASCISLLFACTNKHVDTPKKSQSEFSYLIGNWKRTNEKDDKKTYEHWIPYEKEGLKGFSYTLLDSDTIFKETLKLFKKDSIWNLRIIGVHEQPIDFAITKKNGDSFTAQNSKNDFPSEISYRFKNDILTAKISGDAMDITFIYNRIQN